MEEILYIPRYRTLPPVQDFHFLRSKGLEYIEKLSHLLWTDYNSHDSGITIHESLCFAITELGYRTSFDIKDLMAAQDGSMHQHQAFFTAREIFTCNPVTVDDYRKLLVDILGVHNSWVFPKANVGKLEEEKDTSPVPETEVPVYPDCKKGALVYTPAEHPALDIRGMYEVMLDLDNSDELGDLNAGNIIHTLTEDTLYGVELEAILPRWNEVDWDLLQKIYPLSIKAVQVTKKSSGWDVKLTYDVAGTDEAFSYHALIALRQPVDNLETGVESELNKTEVQEAIIETYFRKITSVRAIIQEAKQRLHAHRNLCEDFGKINTVIPVEIALCADIAVTPEADIEQVLAEVYFLVEEYLNPDVKFYLLSEMLEKHIPTEEIFEGPGLDHGFIDAEELIETQLRSEVRVSDIINLIMDVKGVLSIKNVQLTEYDSKGKAKLPSQEWCLHLPAYHKPVLSIHRSKVLFFKDNLPFKANTQETRDILSIWRGANERAKLKGHDKDLPQLKGTYYQLEEYLTVQYELPQTYGVSPYGLPSTVSEERKAQALQLRAYLMFYDQLLANFFSQLAHAKDLFSTDPGIKQTYFAQYLPDIKDIEKVYLHSASLKSILGAPVAGEATAITKERTELLESSETTYFERRHRFLDHLLARFAESFNEYVLMLYRMEGDKKVKKSQEKLIADKISFLKDYPAISSERGKAFDYLSASWGTENVSGLEKRLARLTGIQDYTRRDLFCFPAIRIIYTGSKYSVSVEDATNVYLASLKDFDTEEEAEQVVNKVFDSVSLPERYRLDKSNSSRTYVKLVDAYGAEIAVSVKYYLKDETAAAFISEVFDKYKPACEAEGMFLIEHLLLRPRFEVSAVAPETKEDKYRLLKVCLEKDCLFCGEEDPYSFRLSVILPFWPERFRDISFRAFFEKAVHTETPAHIAAKVCWVNYTTMQKLQAAYKEWSEALQDYASDLLATDAVKQDRLREANNRLVTLLATMHSEYPEARLHDCETSVTNPVRLGCTVLGTF